MNKALQYCLKILTKRDYTTHEMRQKMQLHNFEVEEIDEAIGVLAAKGFINDKRYVENYLNNHLNRGKIRIKFELIRRGIDSDLIEDSLSEVKADDQSEQALEVAKVWLRHKSKPDVDKYKLKQNLIAKLGRQGFSYEIASDVANKLLN